MPPTLPYFHAEEKYTPYETFEHYHSEHFAGLEGSDKSVGDYVNDHLNQGYQTAQCATDGSVWRSQGTYSFLCFSPGSFDTGSMSSPLYGGGQEDFSHQVEQCLSAINSSRISSTRLEALALLALHISVKYIRKVW